MMTQVQSHLIANLETDLDSKWATKVIGECFESGDEGEIKHDFFILWGSVIKRVYNRSTTGTKFFKLEGEAYDIFRARNYHLFT